MRDVAAAAGVSVKTVSRVVNDEAAVRDDVADRVRAAIDALGYRPDHRAQLLRRRGTASATIGFVPFDVSNPFFSAIYRGLEDAAWTHGYAVVAGSSDGTRERGETILKRLIGGRVDGLVVVPAGDDHTLIAEEVGRGTPVVLLDLEVDVVTEVDLVRSDHRGGARLAVDTSSTTAIATSPSSATCRRSSRPVSATTATSTRCGPARSSAGRSGRCTASTRRRCRGDVRALFAPGVDPAERPVHRPELRDDRRRAGPPRSRACTASSPRRLRRCRHGRHRRAGAHVVPQRPMELGRLAGELLLDRIGGHRGPARRAILCNELIARGSGEIPPSASPP